MLDIDSIEDTDTTNVQAMKILLKYKIQRIEELEQQIEQLKQSISKEKMKSGERIEREWVHWGQKVDFLKEQIDLKDQRIDMLLDLVQAKDAQYMELMKQALNQRE